MYQGTLHRRHFLCRISRILESGSYTLYLYPIPYTYTLYLIPYTYTLYLILIPIPYTYTYTLYLYLIPIPYTYTLYLYLIPYPLRTRCVYIILFKLCGSRSTESSPIFALIHGKALNTFCCRCLRSQCTRTLLPRWPRCRVEVRAMASVGRHAGIAASFASSILWASTCSRNRSACRRT